MNLKLCAVSVLAVVAVSLSLPNPGNAQMFRQRTMTQHATGSSCVIQQPVCQNALAAHCCMGQQRVVRTSRFRVFRFRSCCWCCCPCCKIPSDPTGIPREFADLLDSDSADELTALLEAELEEHKQRQTDIEGESEQASQQLDTHNDGLATSRDELATAESDAENAQEHLEQSRVDLAGRETESENADRHTEETFEEVRSQFTSAAQTPEVQAAKQQANAALATAETELTNARSNHTQAETAKSTAQTQKNTAETAASNAETALTNAQALIPGADQAVTQAQSALSTAENFLENLREILEDLLDDFPQDPLAILDIRERIEDAEEAVDAAEDALSDARDHLGNLEDAVEAAQEVRDQARDALSDAVDELETATTTLANAAQTVTEKVQNVDVRQELVDLRHRAIEEFESAPDELMDMIDRVGTAAEVALKPLVETYKTAINEAENARQAVSTAQTVVNDAIERAANSDEVRTIKAEAVRAREQAVAESERAVEQVNDRVEEVREAVQEVVDMLLDQELIPFDINSKLEMSSNLKSGAFYANIELDFAGASWDSEKTRDAMKGNVSLPSVDPVKLAASCLGVRAEIDESGYYSTRDDVFGESHSANADEPKIDSRTYYASKRFVDWASADTVGRLIVTSIVDGGQTVRNEIKQQLLLEYQAIESWFLLQGQELSDELAAEIVFAIVQGQSLDLPEVEVEFMQVNYELGDLESFGMSFLPEPLRDRAQSLFSSFIDTIQEEAEARGIQLAVPHAAFVIRLKNLPDASLEDMISQFDNASQAALSRENATRIFGLLVDRIPDETVREIVEDLVETLESGGINEDVLFSQLQARLGLTREDLEELYVPGQRIIDLTHTELADNIEGFFEQLGMGNQRSASIKRLEFDLVTFDLSAEVDVRHRHSWGKLQDLVSF